MPNRINKSDRTALLAIASIIAIGGLVYELILGTASSYLFGDSIKSFSVGIGFSLFGMGLGSLLATKFLKMAEQRFIQAELLLSVLGGSSVIILFAAYAYTEIYWLIFIALSTLIGVLIGLEIPLVVETYRKISKKKSSDFLSKILAVDYLGALVGSLMFPFILLPYLGLVRTALAIGVLNISVVLYLANNRNRIIAPKIRTLSTIVLVLLISGLAFASNIERSLTTAQFNDPVVYVNVTPYQRVVITKYKDDTRLYLNNNLQFSSVDEYRYHETLAHSALTTSTSIENILVLGGGDGLLVREVLKYEEVKSITLVDLDPEITDISTNNNHISKVNEYSLSNSKVEVINQDAYQYIKHTTGKYDVILVDLIDPANEKVSKLYTTDFYSLAESRLNTGGVLATQATSTYFTPNAFWSIHASINRVFGSATPYWTNVPSFGEWGFVMTSQNAPFQSRDLPDNMRYLDSTKLKRALSLQPELVEQKHDTHSTLINPKVYKLYNEDLSNWTY